MPGNLFPLEVQPRIPERLGRLHELANDLMYSWDRSIRSLFHRLDRELWDACGHSPKVFLRQVAQQRLEEAVNDRSFMDDYRRVISAYDAYRENPGRPELNEMFIPGRDLIAYFCLEFGFHESFPIYSGGLGILAGDHCKAASDVGLPFVAVGLLYQVGYFNQTIDEHGHQQANYTPVRPVDLPIIPTLSGSGEQLVLEIEFPGRMLKVRVWTARAGHIRLFLLDTNVPENSEEDRAIAHQLYGGDREMRLKQELVLGVGGVRTLRALNMRPTVWHINEGHAAFQLLERCLWRMEQGMNFDCAMEVVAAATVFTTHTPVPAGHDIFEKDLVVKYSAHLVEALDKPFEDIFALGTDGSDGFNMTNLALRCTRFHNGVSRIHGNVASAMEQEIWPQIPYQENPVTHITNGVHLHTFLAREWVSLFDLRFDDWENELLNEQYWERVEELPDYHYWSIHKALKQQLLEEVRSQIIRQQRRNGTSDAVVNHMVRGVDGSNDDVLVMGFARRFATYKRATMLFADPERLTRLLNDPERPTVIIFAGKAHPYDQPGQHLIKMIHEHSMQPEFLGKIILLEGYDMALARHMVAGVDVWINTPEYPLEASGTSGQKAGLNGAVNLSVLDGWWAEGYTGNNGYAINPRDSRFDHDHRYREEAHDLFNIIEHQIFPTYFARDGGGYSKDWVKLSKASMKTIIPRFNAQRMLMDYVHKLYWPARNQRLRLEADHCALGCELSSWKARIRAAWPGVKMQLSVQPPARIYHDELIVLTVQVELSDLLPSDLKLECLLGHNDTDFVATQVVELQPEQREGQFCNFTLRIEPEIAGLQHYKLRLYPYHEALSHPFEVGCMIWI